MPNCLPQAWVKNVYNLRKGTRTTSGIVSPQRDSIVQTILTYVHNHVVIPAVTPSLYPQLYTAFLAHINLLSVTYTHNPQGLLLREKRKDKKGTLVWN